MPSNVGILFGLYAAARHGEDHLRDTGRVVLGTVAALAFVAVLVTGRGRIAAHVSAAGIFAAAASWLLGEAARIRHAYVAEVEAHAAKISRDRDEHAKLAAQEERIRIARELHDVVTHNVIVIAVQAAAARSTAQPTPDGAIGTLAVVERTARATLTELRALLGVLRARGDDARAPLQPPPSIEQLDELVAQARAAGLTVTTSVQGVAKPIDALAELGAYRVLQEALTNVIKHAPQATVEVVVERWAGELQLMVTNDGCRSGQPNRAGYGLTGMRERLELAGGTLDAGPIPAGGFRVHARIPLEVMGGRHLDARRRPRAHSGQEIVDG